MKIDDVVDASPVHMFCGIWGTIAAGLFAHPDNVAVAYGTGSCGLFFKVKCFIVDQNGTTANQRT